jgi:hypothetical protein
MADEEEAAWAIRRGCCARTLERKMCTSAEPTSECTHVLNTSRSLARPAADPWRSPCWMASTHSSGCTRLGCVLAACERAMSHMALDCCTSSSLSTRCSDWRRGARPSAISSASDLAAANNAPCPPASTHAGTRITQSERPMDDDVVERLVVVAVGVINDRGRSSWDERRRVRGTYPAPPCPPAPPWRPRAL